MSELILSPSQAEIVVGTAAELPVLDERGKLLGYFSPVVRESPFTEDDIAAAKAALRAGAAEDSDRDHSTP